MSPVPWSFVTIVAPIASIVADEIIFKVENIMDL